VVVLVFSLQLKVTKRPSAIAYAIIAKGVAEGPDFGDEGVGGHEADSRLLRKNFRY
jgi:hypothetical protein